MIRRPLPATAIATPLRSLFCLLMLLFTPAGEAELHGSTAADIATYGTPAGVPACSSCHGTRGEGNAAVGFPRLAGLSDPYLLAQLRALADGSRNNVMMSPVATLLNEQQRQQLSSWYAALPAARVATEQGSTPQPFAEGRLLAVQGDAARQVPACDRCHGSRGSGVGTTFPALAGQSQVYLENQLRLWQGGSRPGGPLNLMPDIARRLSAQEIQQVAGYYSRITPTATVPQSILREVP